MDQYTTEFATLLDAVKVLADANYDDEAAALMETATAFLKSGGPLAPAGAKLRHEMITATQDRRQIADLSAKLAAHSSKPRNGHGRSHQHSKRG